MSTAGSQLQAAREGIRAFLPEYAGYDEGSVWSQTDRLLREHVRREILHLTAALDGAAGSLRKAQSDEAARAIDRVRRKLLVIADGLSESLREGSSAGVETLDREAASRLYEYDLSIVRRVAELRQEIDGMDIRSLSGSEEDETLILLDDLVDGLSQDLFERDTLIEGQNEVEY